MNSNSSLFIAFTILCLSWTAHSVCECPEGFICSGGTTCMKLCSSDSYCAAGQNCLMPFGKFNGTCQCTAHTSNQNNGCGSQGYGCKLQPGSINVCQLSNSFNMPPSVFQACSSNNDCTSYHCSPYNYCICDYNSDCANGFACISGNCVRRNPKNTLFLLETLTLSSPFLLSSNTMYRARMQNDGNFVIYQKDNNGNYNILKWATNTDGNPNATLEMQSNGDLVLKATTGNVLWSTRTTNLGSYLTLQDNGQLVMYDINNYPRWSAPSQHDSLYPENYLYGFNDESIRSPNNDYMAIMQSDGDLRVYEVVNGVFNNLKFSTGTAGNPNAYLKMQLDGNLALYEWTGGQPLWQSGTSGSNCKLVLRNDGVLTIVDDSSTTIWSTETTTKIKNEATGRFLDINGNGIVSTQTTNSGPFQKWIKEDLGSNVFMFRNLATNSYLSTNTNSNVFMLSKDNSDSQKWTRTSLTLVNVGTSKALDSDANGKVYLLDPNGSSFQNWTFE